MTIDSDRNGERFKTYKQIENESRKYINFVKKCKCSHSVLFTGKKDRLICNHCGNYVYRDEKTKMKYKVKELLKCKK